MDQFYFTFWKQTCFAILQAFGKTPQEIDRLKKAENILLKCQRHLLKPSRKFLYSFSFKTFNILHDF